MTKSNSTRQFAFLVCAIAMTSAQPAWAQGMTVDPNGLVSAWDWIVGLFGGDPTHRITAG